MCVYRTDGWLCKKYSTDGITSYCVDGPCTDEVLTNADRIRSMSDEELENQFILQMEGIAPCKMFISIPTGRMFISRTAAKEAVSEWLHQKAE